MQQAMQEQPEAVQQLQMFASDPRSQQVVAVENNVTELDVDINIDEGFDTPTIAAEEFQNMLRLAGTGMVQIPADVLIEASSLRNKERLLDMLKEGPSPEQQQAQELAIAGQMAQVEKTQSEAVKNQVTAQVAMAKGEAEAYQAGLAA